MTWPCRCSPRKACILLCLTLFVALHVLMLAVFLHHKHYFQQQLHPHPLPISTTTNPGKGFEVQLKGQEMTDLMNTIDIFASALTNASIPFFMYGGTLIGSWRHHGQIPWDDDVDFALPHALKANISEVLSDLQPDFILNTKQGVRWKLFPANATKIRGVPWNFPFLDMSFYYENKTHIWDEDKWNFKTFVFSKATVFPLIFRPFEGRQLPAPNDTLVMLAHNYDLDVCQTGSYSHRTETAGHKIKSVQCQQLKPLFPFVKRVALKESGCNETLVKGGEVLSWYAFTDQPC